MALVRSVPRGTISLILAAIIIAAAILGGSVYVASSESHDVTYHACLYAGSLSQVSTTPPANCGRGMPISWNAAGPEGSQGEPGPQGEQGEPGPEGPSGISGYQKVSLSFSNESFEAGQARLFEVPCPAGKNVVGGGASLFNRSGPLALHVSRPSFNDAGWVAWFINLGSGTATATVAVYAICVNVSS